MEVSRHNLILPQISELRTARELTHLCKKGLKREVAESKEGHDQKAKLECQGGRS